VDDPSTDIASVRDVFSGAQLRIVSRQWPLAAVAKRQLERAIERMISTWRQALLAMAFADCGRGIPGG
jgi:hypothetical protein